MTCVSMFKFYLHNNTGTPDKVDKQLKPSLVFIKEKANISAILKIIRVFEYEQKPKVFAFASLGLTQDKKYLRYTTMPHENGFWVKC